MKNLGQIGPFPARRYRDGLQAVEVGTLPAIYTGEWISLKKGYLPKPMVTCPKVHDEAARWGSTRTISVLEPVSLTDVTAQVHRTAVLGRDVEVGRGSVIMANVVIEDNVKIGDNVKIYPGCYVGEECIIGDDTVIKPSVTLREGTRVGCKVVIDSGAVVGSDGFGFTPSLETGQLVKIPQVGVVVIEDGAYIGSSATLDRATLGETRIGARSVVGELTQVAHNVEIGEDTKLGSQTGICGSTCIGSNVDIGSRVGIVGHLNIGDAVRIDDGTGVTKNAAAGAELCGTNSFSREDMQMRQECLAKLPELIKRVKALEKSQ